MRPSWWARVELLKHLGSLMEGGLTPEEAASLLAPALSPGLRQELEALVGGLASGALAPSGGRFLVEPPLEGGKLQAAALMMEQSRRLRSGLWGLLAYPGLLTLASILLLPLPDLVSQGVGAYLASLAGPALLLGLVVGGVALVGAVPAARERALGLALALPGVRAWRGAREMALLGRLLAHHLDRALPLDQALCLAGRAQRDRGLGEALEAVAGMMAAGCRPAEALRAVGRLPEEMMIALAAAERTGVARDLGEMAGLREEGALALVRGIVRALTLLVLIGAALLTGLSLLDTLHQTAQGVDGALKHLLGPGEALPRELLRLLR